jgi:hypothetical protein
MIWWDLSWGPIPSGTVGFFRSLGEKYGYNKGWWLFLDTTWDTPFGTDPAWLQWYKDTDIMRVFNDEAFTWALCDYNGWVSYTPSGAGTGMGISMP